MILLARQNNKCMVTVAVIAHVACCGVSCRYGSPNPTTSGSSSLFTPTNLDWSAAITPYIRDYDPITPCPTSGFCLDPTTIVLNTDPVSVTRLPSKCRATQ